VAACEADALGAQVLVLRLQLVAQGADLLDLKAQLLLRALAVHRVGEDLAHQPDAVDRLLVPGPVIAEAPVETAQT
jgi:hypothetical protein